MINPKLQNLITKYINRRWSVNETDYEEYIDELKEILDDDFNYKDVIEGIFTYIINEKNENPFDYFEEEFLDHNFYPKDVHIILNDSGWYEKYFNYDRFVIPNKKSLKPSYRVVYNDVEITGDNLYLICGEWSDFTNLFEPEDQNLVERVLGQDWAELYGYFDVDFEDDVKDNLDEKSIEHIKNYIKENNFIGQPIEVLNEEYGEVLIEEDLNDVDTLFHLISEEPMFSDLSSELESFYRWAYESAGEDELFSELSNEIKNLLKSDGDWDTHNNKTVLKFNISRIFMEINSGFLECTGKFPDSEFSNFIDVLESYLECEGERLRARDMDYFYPDSSRVSEHLNYNVIGNL